MKPIHRYSDRACDELVKMRAEGFTLDEIAAQYGVASSTIHKRLKRVVTQGDVDEDQARNGKPKTLVKWSLMDDDVLIQLRTNGAFIKNIAIYFSVSTFTIRERLRKLANEGRIPQEVAFAREQNWSRDREEELLRLRKNGVAVKDIAEMFSVTDRTIRNRLAVLCSKGLIPAYMTHWSWNTETAQRASLVSETEAKVAAHAAHVEQVKSVLCAEPVRVDDEKELLQYLEDCAF